MKALIDTLSPRETGYRVCQVVEDNMTFPIESFLFWTDFPSVYDPTLVGDDVYWYDPSDKTIKLRPLPPEPTV
jgi:hypothetical protein